GSEEENEDAGDFSWQSRGWVGRGRDVAQCRPGVRPDAGYGTAQRAPQYAARGACREERVQGGRREDPSGMPPAEALPQAPGAARRDDLSAAAVGSGAVRAYARRRFTPDGPLSS